MSESTRVYGRWVGVLAAALLAPAVALAQGEAEPAVEEASAAGVASESPAAPAAPEDPPDVIRQEIAQLEALLAGELAEPISLRTLLRVDVLADASVDERIEQLRAAIASYQAERAEILQRSGPLPDPEHPGGEDAAPEAGDGGEPAGDGELADLSADDAARVEHLDLLIQRDGLCLAFLSLPLDERAEAVAAIEEMRRVAAERLAAEAARLAAEEAAERAEAARQQAMAEAAEARSAALRELANERVRVEDLRSEVADQHSAFADQRLSHAEEAAARLQLAQELAERLDAADLRPAEADKHYDAAVERLTSARDELDAALDELRADSTYPAYEPGFDVNQEVYLEQPVERDALLQAVEAFEAERDDAAGEERRYRWERVDALASQADQLDDARLALLPLLSRDKRERVLGVGPQGLGQLAREARHCRVMGRWYAVSRARDLRDVPSWLLDVLGRSSSRLELLMLLCIVGLYGAFHRRRVVLLTWFNKRVRARLAGSSQRRSMLGWLRLANALIDELALVLTVWLGAGLAIRLAPIAEVVLLCRIALIYALYRLALAAAHQFFVSAASLTRTTVPQALSDRILRSIRLGGRYVLAVVIFLQVAAVVLGRGYLYRLVLDFAWIGAFPITYALHRWWRDDILDSYQRLFPSGRLRGAIERHRGRVTAFVVVVPAAILLAGRMVVIYVRNVALRFERIRKALAYLFRRRLETKAEVVGLGTTDVTVLPAELRDAFFRPPEGELRVDHFPHMDEVLQQAGRFVGGGPGRAVALVGVRGVGRSEWLQELHRRLEGAEVVRASMDESLVTEKAVCMELARVLEVSGAPTADQLCERILGGPRRVVLLDNCYNFVLRSVRGIEGYDALRHLLRRTVGHTFWVCAYAQYTWEYMQFAAGEQDIYREVLTLPGWPERRIRELIERRLDAAGFEASYRDLLDREVHPVELDIELKRTRERYLRLLWDYTDGIPALALHFWLRSLVPGVGKTAKVRLFDGPKPDQLEHLSELSRFVLAAVLTHEVLTLEEAERVLQMPAERCLSVLELLRAQGYLCLKNDRYRVDIHWDRAAARYLRRKHLLYR